MEVRETLNSIHEMNYFKGTRGPTERVKMSFTLKEFLYRYLYYLICDEGKNLPQLFDTAPVGLFPKDLKEIKDIDLVWATKSNSFFTIDKEKVTKVHRHSGRNCGRKFKIGEPLYRCHECGCDETCVLCIFCFNPEDHVGHHVYTDICSDVTSGICDCGDEEAWNVPLNCKAELEEKNQESTGESNASNENTFMKPETTQLIEVILEEVIDHFIDVFNQNLEPLPTFQHAISLKLKSHTQFGKIKERSEFLNDFKYKNFYNSAANYGETNENSSSNENIPEENMDKDSDEVADDVASTGGVLQADKTSEDCPTEPKHYTVMIYNDEFHNYSQATTALRQGVPDNVHTDLLTSRIDSEGRAMLKCSMDLSSVMGGFFAVQTNGLTATLTSWDEYIHQEACKHLIFWITHCLAIPDPDFQNTFRDALGKVLCSQYDSTKTVDMNPFINKHFEHLFEEEGNHDCLNMSVLAPGNKIPLGKHKALSSDSIDKISTGINELIEIKDKNYTNSRVQYLLYFDNRYWKRLRKEVQNMIIPTLSSFFTYKPYFCRQVVEIFNHMTRSVAYMDREPQLTALRECIVQLFTCPTNAAMIFNDGSFIDIVWSVFDIFAEFCKYDGPLLLWQRVQKSNPTKSYSISFKQGLYTVETLLSKVADPNIPLRAPEFVSIVTLCKIFNGAWKLKRKEGEHILHEDQYFIPYLEYTTSIYSIIQTIEKIMEQFKDQIDTNLLRNAIKLVNTFLAHRSLTYREVAGTHEIIKFEVSREPVAYMNPVQTLFSFLIEKTSLTEAKEIVLRDCNDFLKISDFSLRAVVLCAQIDVGFWVRNGVSVLHQASYYRNNPELNSYSRDIHLNQLALLWEVDDIPRILYNILDRWELLSWFTGETEYNNTVYEDKIGLVIQQFITFLYHLLTERRFFKNYASAKEKRFSQIKTSIMYSLYTKPLSYSKLLKNVPDYLSEDGTEFDKALSEVSTFMEPKGLADNGVFVLKDNLYSKIDPLRLDNLENEFESSASIIKSHLATSKEDVNKTILVPQLIHPKHLDPLTMRLGAFTRTGVFAKLMYKLLQVCLDTENGLFLNELLHLIHCVFKDDEQVNGKSSIPQNFISKSICNLFLSIANAKSDIFSESITSKADYLLEVMIRKNPEDVFDSLITGFGLEYVDEYKTKKLNQGVILEETEKEKKKRLAKKHQAKLMAKFNSQQSKFMKENSAVFDDKENELDMLGNKITASEDFTCSLCQDDTSDDFFVVPVYHDFSPAFREADVYSAEDYSGKVHGFFNDEEKASATDATVLEDLRLNSEMGSRKVFVSCNHHIHHNCFRRYIQKKRFSSNAFICPLCQTFSNAVIPICQTDKSEEALNLNSFGMPMPILDIVSRLFKNFTVSRYKSIHSIFNLILPQINSFDKIIRKSSEFNDTDTSLIMAAHWANTISMLEISSRLDPPDTNSYIKGREQKFKTLGNILISMSLFYYIMGKPTNKLEIYDSSSESGNCYNQVLQYIVKSTLFENTPVKEAVSRVMFVLIKQTVQSYFKCMWMNDSREDYQFSDMFKDGYEAPELVVSAIRQFENEYFKTNISKTREVHEKDQAYYNIIYSFLLNQIVPSYKRVFIMLKVFHNLVKESEDQPLIIDDVNIESDISIEDYVSFANSATPLLTEFTDFDDMFVQALLDSKFTEGNDTYLKDIPHEYPGVVKLINLKKYLNTYVTDSKQFKLLEEALTNVINPKNRLDFRICLTCGMKVHLRTDRREMSRHLTNCFSSFGLFLMPNTSEVCLFLSQPPSNIFISAPYLNSHGEVGRNAMRRGDLTTLNLKRYEHLNKLWINNEVTGYISRVMGDEFRVNILSNGFLFEITRGQRFPTRPTEIDEDNDFYDDEEIRDVDMDDEDLARGANGIVGGPAAAAAAATTLFGFPNAAGAQGDVRDFFQIFEDFRDAVQNGDNDEQDFRMDLEDTDGNTWQNQDQEDTDDEPEW